MADPVAAAGGCPVHKDSHLAKEQFVTPVCNTFAFFSPPEINDKNIAKYFDIFLELFYCSV